MSRTFGAIAFFGGILSEFLRTSNIIPPRFSIPLSVLCFLITATTERIQGGKSKLKEKLEKADIVSIKYATMIDKNPKLFYKDVEKDNVYEGE